MLFSGCCNYPVFERYDIEKYLVELVCCGCLNHIAVETGEERYEMV